jgi:hypothetical protein
MLLKNVGLLPINSGTLLASGVLPGAKEKAAVATKRSENPVAAKMKPCIGRLSSYRHLKTLPSANVVGLCMWILKARTKLK